MKRIKIAQVDSNQYPVEDIKETGVVLYEAVCFKEPTLKAIKINVLEFENHPATDRIDTIYPKTMYRDDEGDYWVNYKGKRYPVTSAPANSCNHYTLYNAIHLYVKKD